MKNTVVLLLGSNMNNRLANLEAAGVLLLEKCNATFLKQSSVYETDAWGNTNQPSFLNCVAVMLTTVEPDELMNCILEIEHQLGRERKKKWESRNIDIDILFYNDLVLNSKDLTIPHPHLHERRFTLIPLAEIIPGWIHPVFQKSVFSLLNECQDALGVTKLETK